MDKRKKVNFILTEKANEELNCLSRKFNLTKGEFLEVLIQRASKNSMELENVLYIESRENFFERLVLEIEKLKTEIATIKNKGGF